MGNGPLLLYPSWQCFQCLYGAQIWKTAWRVLQLRDRYQGASVPWLIFSVCMAFFRGIFPPGGSIPSSPTVWKVFIMPLNWFLSWMMYGWRAVILRIIWAISHVDVAGLAVTHSAQHALPATLAVNLHNLHHVLYNSAPDLCGNYTGTSRYELEPWMKCRLLGGSLLGSRTHKRIRGFELAAGGPCSVGICSHKHMYSHVRAARVTSWQDKYLVYL